MTARGVDDDDPRTSPAWRGARSSSPRPRPAVRATRRHRVWRDRAACPRRIGRRRDRTPFASVAAWLGFTIRTGWRSPVCS